MKLTLLITVCVCASFINSAQTYNFNSPSQWGNNNKQYNYYGDTSYVPDNLNIIAQYLDKRKNMIGVMPKYGAWTKPFVIYPDTFRGDHTLFISSCTGSGGGWSTGTGINIWYKDKMYRAFFDTRQDNVTSQSPFCIPLYIPEGFFIFGDCIDCKDKSKWYTYDNGKISWFRTDENFNSKQ